MHVRSNFFAIQYQSLIATLHFPNLSGLELILKRENTDPLFLIDSMGG